MIAEFHLATSVSRSYCCGNVLMKHIHFKAALSVWSVTHLVSLPSLSRELLKENVLSGWVTGRQQSEQ